MKLYIEHLPTEGRPLLAGDHTTWPRPEAVTLKDRTIEHQPTQIAGNKPIAVGHGFSTVLLVAIGTPAGDPKPRGKSPGWPQGKPRQRRARYPVVKKTTPKAKTLPKTTNPKPA